MKNFWLINVKPCPQMAVIWNSPTLNIHDSTLIFPKFLPKSPPTLPKIPQLLPIHWEPDIHIDDFQ